MSWEQMYGVLLLTTAIMWSAYGAWSTRGDGRG